MSEYSAFCPTRGADCEARAACIATAKKLRFNLDVIERPGSLSFFTLIGAAFNPELQRSVDDLDAMKNQLAATEAMLNLNCNRPEEECMVQAALEAHSDKLRVRGNPSPVRI